VCNEPGIMDIPSSYASKLKTKANLRKLEVHVPNDADYEVWLPLTSVHEKVTMAKGFFFFKFSSIEGVDLVLRDVWVKFHDVPLVSYTSDGLRLIAMKISAPMMIDSYTNSMCLESCGRNRYARVLIEINACNDFSDNLVMIVPNLEGTGYTKETIRIEYEVDDEGFIEVKMKKSGGNNGGNKHFKLVSVKPKTHYRPKAKQSTEGTSNSLKTTFFVGTNKASTSVRTGSKATTSGMYDEGKISTPIVERINVFEKQIPEGKLVFDDGKPLE
ncbi:hypothetical protein Tco_0133350, partial [Tanacetum coccineum]